MWIDAYLGRIRKQVFSHFRPPPSFPCPLMSCLSPSFLTPSPLPFHAHPFSYHPLSCLTSNSSITPTELSQARQEAFDSFRRNYADTSTIEQHKRVLKAKWAEEIIKVGHTYTYSLQDRYFSPGMQRQRHWENESTLHESPSVSVLSPCGSYCVNALSSLAHFIPCQIN